MFVLLAQMDSKFDKDLARDISDWIHRATGESVCTDNVDAFGDALKDGQILCKYGGFFYTIKPRIATSYWMTKFEVCIRNSFTLQNAIGRLEGKLFFSERGLVVVFSE